MQASTELHPADIEPVPEAPSQGAQLLSDYFATPWYRRDERCRWLVIGGFLFFPLLAGVCIASLTGRILRRPKPGDTRLEAWSLGTPGKATGLLVVAAGCQLALALVLASLAMPRPADHSGAALSDAPRIAPRASTTPTLHAPALAEAAPPRKPPVTTLAAEPPKPEPAPTKPTQTNAAPLPIVKVEPAEAAPEPPVDDAPPLSPEQLLETVQPAVVRIITRDAGGWVQYGSGFFIDTSGTLVTTKSLTASATQAVMLMQDGKRASLGTPEHQNPESPVAIFRTSARDTTALSLSPVPARADQPAWASRHPQDAEGASAGLTEGIVERVDAERLQVAMPIGARAAGGPVVNRGGRVIAILSAFTTGSQDVRFAIPASAVQELLNPSETADPAKPAVQQPRPRPIPLLADRTLAWIDQAEGNKELIIALMPTWMAMERGDRPGAARLASKIDQQWQSHALYWLTSATTLLDMHDKANALPSLAKAVSLDPDLLEARALYAAALLDAEQFSLAEQHAKYALKLDEAHPRALGVMGYLKARSGDQSEGVAMLNEAISLSPGMASNYALLSEVQRVAGDVAGAHRSMARAVAIDRTPEYLFALAQSHIAIGSVGEARPLLEETTKVAPSAEAYRTLARVFVWLSEHDEPPPVQAEKVKDPYAEAAASGWKVPRVDPKLSGAAARRAEEAARRLEAQRKRELVKRHQAAALRASNAAVGLEPASREGWLQLARIAVQVGAADRAVEAYRRAIRLGDNSPETQRDLALLLYENRERVAGYAMLEQLTEHHPDFADGWYQLGLIQLKTGRRPELWETLAKLKEVDPLLARRLQAVIPRSWTPPAPSPPAEEAEPEPETGAEKPADS